MSVARWYVIQFSAGEGRRIADALARLNIFLIQSHEDDARSVVLLVVGELNRVRGFKPTGMRSDNLPVPTMSDDDVRASTDVMNGMDAGVGSYGHHLLPGHK
jgi:hypothetical protein